MKVIKIQPEGGSRGKKNVNNDVVLMSETGPTIFIDIP